jgi:hypothetical protein
MFVHTSWAFDPLAVRLPDTPVPPGSQWEWVGQQMVVDGLPMSVKLFTFPGTEAELKTHFNGFWKTQSHGKFFQRILGLTHFIGHSNAERYTTVQYTVGDGVIEGKIVTTPPPLKARRKIKPSLPTPPGADLVNLIQSRDGGQDFETITLDTHKPVKQNATYYDNQLGKRGWSRIYQKGDAEYYSAQYQSSGGLLQISIKRLPAMDRNSSRVLIHLIKQ